MENATNALLIAGGILITIIVLSLGVGLYTMFSNQAKESSQIMENTEIQKFNSNFDVYIGREDITAQEIVSVINLANEYKNKIKITIDIDYSMKYTSENFLKKYSDTIFKCGNPKYDETGRITELQFSKT